MNELVKKLAHFRLLLEDERQVTKALEQKIAISSLGMQLEDARGSISRMTQDIVYVESQIKTEALAVYAAELEALIRAEILATNKHPHPAVTIKEFTVLDYDPKLALDYCVTHWPAALKLNVAAFEKISKIARPDFVTEHVEPRAQIATDLSQYVDTAEVPDAIES